MAALAWAWASICLYLLKIETHCQKFYNVSYVLRALFWRKVRSCFIRNIDRGNQTNGVLIGNTAGKSRASLSFCSGVCFGIWRLLAKFLVQNSTISFNTENWARDFAEEHIGPVQATVLFFELCWRCRWNFRPHRLIYYFHYGRKVTENTWWECFWMYFI